MKAVKPTGRLTFRKNKIVEFVNIRRFRAAAKHTERLQGHGVH